MEMEEREPSRHRGQPERMPGVERWSSQEANVTGSKSMCWGVRYNKKAGKVGGGSKLRRALNVK